MVPNLFHFQLIPNYLPSTIIMFSFFQASLGPTSPILSSIFHCWIQSPSAGKINMLFKHTIIKSRIFDKIFHKTIQCIHYHQQHHHQLSHNITLLHLCNRGLLLFPSSSFSFSSSVGIISGTELVHRGPNYLTRE